jgi:hypothetical protein
MKKTPAQGSVAVIINDGAKQAAAHHGIRKPMVQVMEIKNNVAYVAENHSGLSAAKVMGTLQSDETVQCGVRLITWKTQVEDGYLEEHRMPLVPVGLEHLDVRM